MAWNFDIDGRDEVLSFTSRNSIIDLLRFEFNHWFVIWHSVWLDEFNFNN